MNMRHHLAILYAHYIDAILDGRKTVECRLSKLGNSPHGVLLPGDLIWLKDSCGPVRAVASVGMVRSFDRLTPARIAWLRKRFNEQIMAPPAFWHERSGARFATLVWLKNVCALQPFRVAKSDRRAWVVLAEPPAPNRPVASVPDRLA